MPQTGDNAYPDDQVALFEAFRLKPPLRFYARGTWQQAVALGPGS